MKKAISFILSLAIVLTFNACGNNNSRPDENNTQSPGTTVSESENNTSQTQTPLPTELSPQINFSTEINTENKAGGYPIMLNNMVVKGEEGGATLTGYAPLMNITYTATENSGGYSDKKLSHSHGPAGGGEPHHTVVQFQKDFEPFYAVTLDTVSKEKTLYLTFDCGYEYDNLTADILDTLKEKNVPATFFCTLDHIKSEPELISRMITEGHIVGNHSTTHPSFAQISRSEMAKEIEETENYLRENFGYCARYFRFPAGEYTENALDLIASLGYMSVFWSVAYNDWNVDNIQGKDYAVETVMSRLHDGAIILLHSVSRDNAAALGEIIDRARAEGYEFRSLDDLSAAMAAA